MNNIEKPKFPNGSSSWWNTPREELTIEQLELKRRYDRELRAYHRLDPAKKKRDLDIYNKHVENNRQSVYKRNAEWRRDNWDSVYKKRAEGEYFKLTNALRRRLHHAVTSKGYVKSKKTLDLLGCSVKCLREHLENQFQDGMTWDNYGHDTWHIDHILPCDSFDLSKEENQQKCFNYTNLQPLWAKDNLIKGNKLPQ